MSEPSNDGNPQETQPPPSTTTEKVNFASAGLCLKCGTGPATYECEPCGHACFCTDCARKVATGGKCKICSQFFVGLCRIPAA